MTARPLSLRERWLQGWQTRTLRERRAVVLAVTAVLVVGVWTGLLRPALRTMDEAPARLAAAEAQNDRLRALAAEAQALREASGPATAPPEPGQVSTVMQDAARRLGGTVTWRWSGAGGTLSFEGTPAADLQGFIVQARQAARVRVTQARWTTAPQGLSGELQLTAESP